MELPIAYYHSNASLRYRQGACLLMFLLFYTMPEFWYEIRQLTTFGRCVANIVFYCCFRLALMSALLRFFRYLIRRHFDQNFNFDIRFLGIDITTVATTACISVSTSRKAFQFLLYFYDSHVMHMLWTMSTLAALAMIVFGYEQARLRWTVPDVADFSQKSSLETILDDDRPRNVHGEIVTPLLYVRINHPEKKVHKKRGKSPPIL